MRLGLGVDHRGCHEDAVDAHGMGVERLMLMGRSLNLATTMKVRPGLVAGGGGYI